MVTKNPTKTPNQSPPARGPSAPGSIRVCIRDDLQPLKAAQVYVYDGDGFDDCKGFDPKAWVRQAACDPMADNGGVLHDGCWEFRDLPAGVYILECPYQIPEPIHCVEVHGGCTSEVCIDFGLGIGVEIAVIGDDCRELPCAQPVVGQEMEAAISSRGAIPSDADYVPPPGWRRSPGSLKARFRPTVAGYFQSEAELRIPSSRGGPQAILRLTHKGNVAAPTPVPVTGNLTVSHKRRIADPDGPMAFFVRILDASKSVGFGAYQAFIDRVLCSHSGVPDAGEAARECFEKVAGQGGKLPRLERELTAHGVGAYELLKTATEAFLLIKCCIRPCDDRGDPRPGGWPVPFYPANPDLGDYRASSSEKWQQLFCDYLGNQRLPYIQRVIDTAFPAYGTTGSSFDGHFCTDVLLRSRVDNPCFLELIWNYWHEEGMLVQGMNAVSRRFQNVRAPGVRDPLAHMEIDPLRPLNNILWGYVEDERDRLSIKRRAYEYAHQYGLSLYGKAVSALRPADDRSKFIEAFHNLLNKCADYFRAKQDTTVDPDGYPILHAIQELNLILAQGAHNQFGDLAWTARVEMLMQEWIMARPEMRDFLQSRAMVPYKEAWMPQVDTMKTLQGWSDVVVTHFRDLGVYGEQILLTIRWYNWYEVTSEEEAKAWADLLRAQIQTYIHAYRAVTGVDLGTMEGVDYTPPSVHLRKRLALQQRAR